MEIEAIFTAGGSSEPNAITITQASNGTTTVSTSEAVAGTPVTITTTPTDGYSIDACLVYAKETIGGAIYWTLLDVERTDFTHYTFAMPAAPVRVEVTYRQTLLGDVNNDGRVDVTDYIGVANYILGSTPKVFHRDAADVNRDGQIDVSDYIGVANIILGGNGGSGAGGTEPGTGDVPATAD